VKNRKFFISGLFFLQVLLLIPGTEAFAYTGPVQDLDSREGEYFKTFQNRKAVLFESSSSFNIQISFETENEFDPFSFTALFDHPETWLSEVSSEISGYEINRKSILKTQIFPFHFFW
jgi:hypothetical protein